VGRSLRILTAFGGFVLVVCSLAACAPPGPSEQTTPEKLKAMSEQYRAQGFTEQADALEDGKITEDEYRAAYENLDRCITDAGYALTEMHLSPIDGATYLFAFDSSGRDRDVASQEMGECQDRYWSGVSAGYQDLVPVKMDEALRQSALDCMRDKGYDVTGDEKTPLELGGPDPVSNGNPSDRWTAAQECLLDAQGELFPEIKVGYVPFR
jgi:hypothetical protein